MRTKVLVLTMFYLSVFCVTSLAQKHLTVKDYQLLKSDMVTTRSFMDYTWVEGRCGNDYMLKELMRVSCGAVIHFDRHAFIVQMFHNGYSRYGELTMVVGYAVKFGGKVAVGMRYYYLYQHVDKYEAQHSITFDLSLYAQLSQKLCFGFEVYNPARLKYSIRGPDIIPMHFTMLAHYLYGEKLSFTIQIIKYLPGRFDVTAACYYRPLHYFYLSFGCSLYEAEAGLMLRYRQFYFTVDASYNYRLGFAPMVGVLVQLKAL